MVAPKNRTVSCQVIEIVHNNGHKQVDHDEATEEDETDKVKVGCVAATTLVRIEQFSGGGVASIRLFITGSSAFACQHDVRPGLPCCTPVIMFMV